MVAPGLAKRNEPFGDKAGHREKAAPNAAKLGETLAARGLRLVSGGTDNHLLLVDVGSIGLTGQEAEDALHAVDLTCNKNLIPYDAQPPMKTSGIRLGTAAITTRGLGLAEMDRLGNWIADVLDARGDAGVAARVKAEVAEVARAFPIYGPEPV